MDKQRKYESYIFGAVSPHDYHTKCPHCGHEWREDDWYPGDYDTIETNCPKCEKPLQLTATVSVTVWAAKEITNG